MSKVPKPDIRERKARAEQTSNNSLRRQMILDTAAKLFSSHGYGATSLRDIAAACDMKAGSLYYHFRSRDEIVTEVLRTGVQRVFDKVRYEVALLPYNASAREILGTAIHAHLSALLRLHDYTSANVRIFGQVPPRVRQKLITLRDSYELFWMKLLKRCVRTGQISPQRDLHLCRLFLISAMNGCLEWYQEGPAALDSVCNELTDLFLGGIEVSPAKTASSQAQSRPLRSK